MGKRRLARSFLPSPWWWRLWTLGAALAAVHVLIAFATRYGWSHDGAVRDTARQTAMVYGLDWGGGVYVNYLFITIWLGEAWWWRTWPAQYIHRSRAVTHVLRLFYFVIIANAAFVFASRSGRVAGLLLIAALLWAWRPGALQGARSEAGTAERR